MISKNDVKYIQTLFHKKTRDEERVFIAEGPKLVNELLTARITIKKIYALREWAEQQTKPDSITIVAEHELQKISALQTPNQVLAIAAQPDVMHEPNLTGNITLVLDGIQDPGNLGTIIRTADWFGIKQIVASNDTADKYNPKVVQASMGSLIRVSMWHKDIGEWLAQTTIKIYGAMLNGDNVFTANKISEGLLVIGNESKGIRADVLPFIRHSLSIPGRGGAESLNASVATGIILSHIV